MKTFKAVALMGITTMATVAAPMLSSATSTTAPAISPAAATAAVDGTTQATVSRPRPQVTPWGAPALVSPASGTTFYHYPRTTTLTWQRVTGAKSYKVERWYRSGSSWTAYPVAYVNGFNTASYTFAFVGDQSGRWRITAYTGTNGSGTASPASAFAYFTYTTRPQMPAPLLVSPASNVQLDHFPRTLTLAWKSVPGAAGYRVETQYCQSGGANCRAYTSATISNLQASSYTFAFVGAQPGRWRVTTLGGPAFRDSLPSAWRWFSFKL